MKRKPGFTGPSWSMGALSTISLLLFLFLFHPYLTSPSFAQQQRSLSGRVTNNTGQGLSGASVKVKNTTIGTTTDSAGAFTLNVGPTVTLVVSYVGFANQEIPVAPNQNNVEITLQPGGAQLNEVVVIGYGTATKRDLTGSIVKVSGREVADRPNSNAVSSLQGKVAGLNVVNNGTPGSQPDVRIRGTISIGSVRPLYVIDGILNDNMDFVNPNDIESIEVLKDPSSLAIFGVRGAAGVIAVTTKKARGGQVQVNFTTNFGVKRLADEDKIEMVNAEEFKLLLAEEGQNRFTESGATAINDWIATNQSKWTGNTDWVDVLTRTAKFNNNNISITGGTDKNKFYMGLGYTYDEGIVDHVKFERLNLSINDEFKVSKVIKLGFNLNVTREKFPYGGAVDRLGDAKRVAPIIPATKYNDSFYYAMPTIQNTLANPLMELESRWDKTRDYRNRLVGSIFAEISFLRNFTLRSTLYTDLSNQDRRIYTPIIQGYNPEVTAGASPIINITQLTNVTEDREEIRRYQQDHILSYKKNFGEHSFTGTAGFTTYYDGFFKLSGEVRQKSGSDPIPDDDRFWYISNGFGDVSTQRSSSDQREATTVSGLARVLYNFKGKYFLNGSFRRDGSSLIYNPDTRSQNFWAVGAAWDLTKENFMEHLAFFNVLKIKGSMGVLGNQNTYGTSYPYFPTISAGNTAVFGNSVFPSFSNNYLVSRDLKWETVHGKEIGVEMNALNNRLYAEINYYHKKTEDMLAYLRPIGVLPTLGNLGAIKNQGFEIMSRWTQNVSNDWSYSISGNLTTYDNKVTELATPLPADEQYPNQTLVGEPIGYFYGYIVDGVVQSYADKLKSPKFTEFAYGPGDFKYRDLNNDGIIDARDKTRIGNPTPDFTYGGSVNVTFRNIDFSVEVNGVYGNEIYRYWNTSENLFSVYSYPKYLLNRWHGEGTSNWVPIIDQTHKVNRVASTYGIEDGSYFRIRNLQIGYNFRQNTLARAHIKNAKVFLNVQNLKTWRRNLGYSPEFGGTNTNGQAATSFGIDLGNANSAIPQVFTGGINITF